MLRGQRSVPSQIIRCPQCRAERFVLPRSPLPPVVTAPAEAVPRQVSWKYWKWPLAGIVIASLLAIGGLLAALQWTGALTDQAQSRLSPEQQLEQHRREGRAALADGSYQRAAQQLQQAVNLNSRVPAYGPKTKAGQQLVQEQRQAALLADLLSESLGEIIRNSIGRDDDEWEAVFRARYAGKSIILDDVVRRDSNSRHHHQMRIHALGKEAFIELDQLDGMLMLKLQAPQRLLFGFRLSAIQLGPSGVWRIKPERNSLVLLTDASALAGLSITVDAELLEVLKRQEAWFHEGLLP